MSEVRAVFLATSFEAKKIFVPIYKELIKKHQDIIIYNSGPVCQEIKDRNVVITSNDKHNSQIIDSFGCPSVCINKEQTPEEVVQAIEKAVTEEK